jgi:hypothetical protein
MKNHLRPKLLYVIRRREHQYQVAFFDRRDGYVLDPIIHNALGCAW